MIAWLFSLVGGLSLRIKLYAVAAGGLALAFGYLWMRWKISASKAATAEQKAAALQANRDLEQRIAASRAKTRAKQDKIRTEILARARRDHFER